MTMGNKKLNIVVSLLCAALSCCGIWAQLELSSHEPLLLLAFAGLVLMFSACFSGLSRRSFIVAAICALLFALFSVFGHLNALIDRRGWHLWLVIRFAGLFLLYLAALSLAFERLKGLSLLLAEPETRDMSVRARMKVFFLCWLPIVLCFFIWWLYEFPGNTSPDSNHQIMQAMGLIPLSSNHPAVSTLVLGLFYNLGLKFSSGDQNIALSVFTFFQLLFMSAVFAYAAETLYEARLKKWVIAIIVLIYIAVPHHGSYSITVWKDVMFSGFGTALCVSLWRLMLRMDAGKVYPGRGFDIGMLYISALGASLYRNGIYYAFFLLLPFFYLVFRKKCTAAWLMPLIVPIIAIIINGPVFASFNISHNDYIESHSLPAQHIARVIKDGHELTAQQYELLSKAVDVEAVAETYDAGIADPIKALIRSTGDMDYIEENAREYGRLWLELGLEYPGAYLRAQIDQTLGYWYPDVTYWSMSNYCWESDILTIFKDRQLPGWWCSIFDTVYFYLPSMPLAGLIYSIGTATWTLIALFALCIVKKLRKELLVYIPVLALVLAVCFVTPVYAEYRYAYCMFTTLPLLCLIPFARANTSNG